MSSPWQELPAFHARVRGCFLGGALGDALGNPIEFDSLAAIRHKYGPAGITGLVPDAQGRIGLVTDDTQMTLFSAEGLIRADVRMTAKGICDPVAVVQNALLRWLDTQRLPGPAPQDGFVRTGWLREQQWLYAQRAPGNACLSGLETRQHPGRHDGTGRPGPVNPNSKGCGGVMRSAPFGIACPPDQAFDLAADCTRLTHGHPTGYYAAGAFATIIAHLMAGEPLREAVLKSLETLRAYQHHDETSAALRQALDLADEGAPTPEKVERLGQGWVAEEALAIAVYCALAEPASPSAALLLSVNHSGDSDSTGSICGNLIGAQYTDSALPAPWLPLLEGRSAITQLADDFATYFMPGSRKPTQNPRYPGV